MPTAPKRQCLAPGCGALVDAGRCERHKLPSDARGTRTKKYDLRAWRDGIRPAKLRADPLCENCLKDGVIRNAHHVDHVDGNSDNDAWDNLQSLCHSCHSAKTVRHDGGFGHRKKR